VHLIVSHCVDNSAGARKYIIIIIIVSKTVCIPFGDATAPLKRKDAKMLYTAGVAAVADGFCYNNNFGDVNTL